MHAFKISNRVLESSMATVNVSTSFADTSSGSLIDPNTFAASDRKIIIQYFRSCYNQAMRGVA